MDDERRARRRILGLGGLGLAAWYAISAGIMVPWVQNDLTDRVEAKAVAAGFAGVTATFSGQDGTLRCDDPIDDPAALEELAEDVWGVRVASTDGCVGKAAGSSSEATSGDTAATTTTAAATTTTAGAPAESQLKVAATLAEDTGIVTLTGTVDTEEQRKQLVSNAVVAFGADHVIDRLDVAGVEGADSDSIAVSVGVLALSMAGNVTEGEAGYDGSKLYIRAAAVDEDAEARVRKLALEADVADPDVDITVAAPAPAAGGLTASAVLDAGSTSLLLTGTVESEAQRQQLLAAAIAAFGEANVVDQLVVSATSTPVNDAEAAALASLIGSMTPNLVEGTASFDGTALGLTGVYVSDDAKAAVEGVATAAGVTGDALSLSPRDQATADQASTLEQELNDAVGLTPIPFDSGRSSLKPEATTILDQVAALARKYAGVTISVNGHTDGDGSDAANLALSQARADTVRQALIDRGIPAEQLVAQGFGESQPVAPNDTPENKALNRRVVFSVVTQ